MANPRYTYVFSLTGQENTDMITAKSKFKTIDIIRMGIKEALKQCPKPSRKLIEETKNMIISDDKK